MRQIIKKSCCVILAFITCFGFVACNGNKDNDSVKLNESDLTIWGVHASEKVMQDKEIGYYSGIRTDADIALIMARGEYEGAQIIITPEKDVPYYNVEVSDLTSAAGDKIPKNKISVYHERYIPVSVNAEKTNVPLGMYPDALVPFSAIAKYEENKIEANKNQGVYLTIETSVEQPVGTYKGTVLLDFKSYKKSVPITVQVVDVTVSETTHSKSCFSIRWRYQQGELDTSQEKVEAYCDALIKYRLAPEFVMVEHDYSDEGMDVYVDISAQYLLNQRLSCLSIPCGSTTEHGYATFNEQRLATFLRKYVAKSYELNFNLLDKLIFYNATIDEATAHNLPDEQVLLNGKLFNQTVEAVAREVEEDESVNSLLKSEIAQSIRTMPHVNTFGYEERYADYDGENKDYINTFCPLFNLMDTEEQRAQYVQNEKQPEMWWYGCNNPIYPYTSYHIDIADTLPPRLLGWMQAEYGIVGNLYWAVNDYGLLDDYYTTDAYRAHGKNMEGILFYPGGQYGLTEPVGSLRLESIRDGLEEYEIIYAIKEKYKELGLSSKSWLSSLSASLYKGAQNIATVDDFKQARQSLFEASIALQSPSHLCITDLTESNGKMISKVYASDGYELKNGGKTVTDRVKFGDGYIYTIKTDLASADANYLDLACTGEGETYTLTQYLGGRVEEIKAEDLVASVGDDGATVTAKLIDTPIAGETGKILSLDIGGTVSSDEVFQTIKLVDKSLNEKVGKNTQKVVISFYNNGNEDLEIALSVKFKKDAIYVSSGKYAIKPKETSVIELSFSSTKWEKTGALENIRMRFGNGYEESGKTVCIKNILIYDK